MSAADFDAWLAEHPSDDLPAAFAQWLANQTREPILAEQVNGDDVIVAAPDNET